MSRVTFARLSDAPPPLREMLDVEADGSWRAWRSVGQAIGRFAGDGATTLAALAERAATESPPPTGELPPDASVDRITITQAGRRRSHVRSFGSTQRPAGAWGELVAACRALLDDAIAHPTAAIGLVVTAPDLVRLEHRGDGPLPIELGSAQVEATVWKDGAFVVAGSGQIVAGHVDAGPGWSLEVPLTGIDPSASGDAVVFVSFVADDGGVYIPVTLSAGRAPG